MKTLLILRHAKSSWKAPDLDDHDRPLNKRGARDAPRVGRLLRERGWVPDLILCSTAARARATAALVAEAAGCKGELRAMSELYLAEPEAYVDLVREVDDSAASVLVVGHNPGIEQLLHLVCDADEDMPTAALARVVFAVPRWREVRRGQLEEIWRPRDDA